MDLHLKGKNAVILGGTRGIGLAIAETLAAEGANVAVCARNAKQVEETVAALKAKGVKATGAVIGAGVDAVTTSDAETLRAERRACERRVRRGSNEDCRRYRTDD